MGDGNFGGNFRRIRRQILAFDARSPGLLKGLSDIDPGQECKFPGISHQMELLMRQRWANYSQANGSVPWPFLSPPHTRHRASAGRPVCPVHPKPVSPPPPPGGGGRRALSNGMVSWPFLIPSHTLHRVCAGASAASHCWVLKSSAHRSSTTPSAFSTRG